MEANCKIKSAVVVDLDGARGHTNTTHSQPTPMARRNYTLPLHRYSTWDHTLHSAAQISPAATATVSPSSTCAIPVLSTPSLGAEVTAVDALYLQPHSHPLTVGASSIHCSSLCPV